MTEAPRPKRLNRSAVKRSFPRVREATWENLFDYEKSNGLVECRVQGPDKHAYYDVERLMLWLQERDLYRRSDFYEPGEWFYEGPIITRKHALMAW